MRSKGRESQLDANEVAAVVVAVATAVLVIGLLIALTALTKTLRLLRTTVDELRLSALPLVADARATVAQASQELERVDTLLGSAESITATVDSASRLAYLAFSNPVIKLLAFGSGTARATRRLRRGRAAEIEQGR